MERPRTIASSVAAGYAAMYRESGLDPPAMAQARHALDFILRQQEPYPALVMDRLWNVLEVNQGSARFQARFLDAKAVPRQFRTLDLDGSMAPFLPIEFRKDGLTLRCFTTLTTLGTPHDITLQELRIESFFPADEATEALSGTL